MNLNSNASDKTIFHMVLAFDYYDGPERGIACVSSGECYRFVSIGDSKSRLFRAFEFSAIGKGWLSKFEKILSENRKKTENQIHVVSGDTELLRHLEAEIASVEAKAYYVGVGPPNMSALLTIRVSFSQLEQIHKTEDWISSFRLVHQLVKKGRHKKSLSDNFI